MKRYDVTFRTGEASAQTETVEAEDWRTEDGRLVFHASGKKVAEYNVKEWIRVRVVAEPAGDVEAMAQRCYAAFAAQMERNGDLRMLTEKERNAWLAAAKALNPGAAQAGA